MSQHVTITYHNPKTYRNHITHTLKQDCAAKVAQLKQQGMENISTYTLTHFDYLDYLKNVERAKTGVPTPICFDHAGVDNPTAEIQLWLDFKQGKISEEHYYTELEKLVGDVSLYWTDKKGE